MSSPRLRRDQRMFVRLPIRDIRECPDLAAIGQALGTHLQNGSIWPRTLIGVVSMRHIPALHRTLKLGVPRLSLAELMICPLPVHDALEGRLLRQQVRGQTEKFDRPLIQHRNSAIGPDHRDPLRHIVQGRGQRLTGVAHRLSLAQDHQTDHEAGTRKQKASREVKAFVTFIRGEHIRGCQADGQHQGIAAQHPGTVYPIDLVDAADHPVGAP